MIPVAAPLNSDIFLIHKEPLSVYIKKIFFLFFSWIKNSNLKTISGVVYKLFNNFIPSIPPHKLIFPKRCFLNDHWMLKPHGHILFKKKTKTKYIFCFTFRFHIMKIYTRKKNINIVFYRWTRSRCIFGFIISRRVLYNKF